jgi:hypothetical protein
LILLETLVRIPYAAEQRNKSAKQGAKSAEEGNKSAEKGNKSAEEGNKSTERVISVAAAVGEGMAGGGIAAPG